MSKATESHVVEFWSKPFKEVQDHEVPHVTVCLTVAEAIVLESRLHAIGWPARALTLATRVDRLNLTSKR
jgi:hypothetical protein